MPVGFQFSGPSAEIPPPARSIDAFARHVVVTDLPDGHGLVALFRKPGVQKLGAQFPCAIPEDIVLHVIVIAERYRKQSRHEAGAGRAAKRKLAVGPGKNHTAPGQPVHVRRFGVGIPPGEGREVIQVIDRDEEDVGLVSGILRLQRRKT